MKEIFMMVLAGAAALLSGNLQTKTEQATAYLENGQYEEAIETYEEGYYDLRVDRSECDRGLGITYYENEDYEQAAHYLALALDEGTLKTPSLCQMLGISYLKNGDAQAAADILQEGLNLPQTMVIEEGTEKETTVDYSQTVRGLKYNYITALEELGRTGEAYTALQEYLEQYPDDATAQKELEFYSTQYHGEQ